MVIYLLIQQNSHSQSQQCQFLFSWLELSVVDMPKLQAKLRNNVSLGAMPPQLKQVCWGCGSINRVLTLYAGGPRIEAHNRVSQVWRYMPIIPALERWRQEHWNLKVILSYMVS